MPVSFLCFFVTVPWMGLHCVVMAFPGHIYFFAFVLTSGAYESKEEEPKFRMKRTYFLIHILSDLFFIFLTRYFNKKTLLCSVYHSPELSKT